MYMYMHMEIANNCQMYGTNDITAMLVLHVGTKCCLTGEETGVFQALAPWSTAMPAWKNT